MSRPRDWHVLDLDDDPVPGEPGTVRELARTARRTEDDAATAEREVRSLAGDHAVLSWIGAAADVFATAIGDFPGKLGKVGMSYGLAADALTSWADTLDDVQRDADDALRRGRDARARMEALSGQLGVAEQSQLAAVSASRLLSAPPRADVPPPDPAQVQQAVRNAQHAAARADALNGQLGDAQAELSLARRLALQAKSVREDAAGTTARRLHAAAEAGIEPDSFWHDLKEIGGTVWKVVVVAAKVVGFLALAAVLIAALVGASAALPVIAAVAAVAAVVVLIDAVVKLASGEGSGWDVVWALLAFVPFAKGLRYLGKGFKQLKTLAVEGTKLGGKVVRAVAGKVKEAASAVRRGIEGLVKRVRGNRSKPDAGEAHPAPLPGRLPASTSESVANKLDRYLLNPDHPVGASKAKWFREALGFTRDNADGLARQIVFDPARAVATNTTQHGQKFEQVIGIQGVNGRVINVTFAWIRNNDGIVRLVTAIPTKR